MTAYELKAHFDAGLQLAGQTELKELQWMGTDTEWRLYEAILWAYQQHNKRYYGTLA